MRNYKDVKVEQAALHVVAPKGRKLRLSETSLELDGGVADFLGGHVLGGLVDNRAKAAKFVVFGEDRVSGLCGHLLASAEQFVDRSGRLAQLLYSASEGDERVSDGSFIVMRCRSGEELFIAMLKLDPSNQYRTIEDIDKKGRPSNRLELETDILPSVRERLLKAAFVRSVRAANYDMLLLDNQRPGEVVSRFFIQDFLGAETAFDDKTRTVALYKALVDVQNHVAGGLEPTERERLDVYIRGQVAGNSVNVDELLTGLPIKDDVRELFRQKVESELPDRGFDIDTVTAVALLKSRKFVGDNGLKVTVPQEFFQDMVSLDQPGADGYWTITIRTRRWDEA